LLIDYCNPFFPVVLTEGDFLEYIFQQLCAGHIVPTVAFNEATLDAIEAEPIGEHFLRYPFLY